MAVLNEDVYKMLGALSNEDRKSAFDFIEFLVEHSKNKKPQSWQDIDDLGSDEEPLTDEERRLKVLLTQILN